MSKTKESAVPIHIPNLFKVDDIVRVVGIVPKATGWDESWVPSMDKMVGRSGKVIAVTKAGYKVVIDNAYYFYPSPAIEKVAQALTLDEIVDMTTKKTEMAVKLAEVVGGTLVGSDPTKTDLKPKKRTRIKAGPWDAAPCTHLRWNLMGFFREKLAIMKTSTKVTLTDGTTQDIPLDKVDISCTRCGTKMTLRAK
jgi:hypothetical protein